MVMQRFGHRSIRFISRTRNIRTQHQPQQDNSFSTDSDEYLTSQVPLLQLASPRQLVEYLNQYIVGQEAAKKVLSVAVFNHYNRVRANMEMLQARETISEENSSNPEDGVQSAKLRPLRSRLHPSHLLPNLPTPMFEKSNVLMIGPTGSGKTLLAKTLAKVLDVPFSVSDATSFTQAGYVGEDVEMAVQRLLQAAHWDPLRASMGIIYIDEIDKIARKTDSSMDGTRDVSGEGVQQALLRMMEGSVVSVQVKGTIAESAGAPGQGRSRGGRAPPGIATAPKPDIYHVDTSNVLFILSGAFVGLENIIKQRVSKASIGFSPQRSSVKEPSPPFFTSNKKEPPNPLGLVDTVDLVKYGFIPEFISRLPSITSLAPLTIPDLRRILTEVKGSLLSQYQALFGYSGVEIRFTSAAIDEICRKAADRGGGARGLRGIMEKILLEPMYEVPGSSIRHVLITEKVVRGEGPPDYWPKGSAVLCWEKWADEENRYEAENPQPRDELHL